MQTLNIAAVQLDIKWLDKTRNLSHIDDLIRTEINTNIDLILLPETFSTGFCINKPDVEEVEESSQVLDWLKESAKKYNAVMAGSVLVKYAQKKVNRFYWVFPSGRVEFYDKRHLFRLGNEGDYVLQGNERKVITIKGVKILPLVCYDLRFPVWARNNQDYDLIVNVANWPSARRKIWDTLLMARAIENQAYVIGVNRVGEDGNAVAHCGGTALYDFSGETLSCAKNNKEQVVRMQLNIDELTQFKAKFPAYLDADNFEII
ncbi:amidohydrolase [Pseudoalteromonas denitrificans]|uniref:Omega-amidase YafV n=1 Tax=Pseudoalteromonas denitrificans DSM 6059 TaxID=1123010 RepID=A0A1I1RGE7_9GAMM|nr:amidohydrolase [Pseudoalteromonas denitrificans]SFD33272.1 Carbon-nitrogen hydrolase [Pseudoalteromonas denitrificans DSM 6059]